ncbi:MAG: acyl-CoA dehydrogenase family protein [Nitriliruptorales bacterium]|nr:acyl-CoA dehydrogenase family protein [Nitriliruptorales bacterium]
MNFDLDETERALQEGIRELVDGRVTSERIRAAGATGGVDRDLFAELGEAGVFGLRLPEEQGGLGLGFTHAAVVFEQLGRTLVPGPVVATHLSAGVVEGAADGATVVGAVDESTRTIPNVAGLDVLLVTGPEGVRRIDPAAVSGEDAARPLDPVTPIRVVSGFPDGEPLDGLDPGDWHRGSTLLHAALLVGNAAATTDLMVAFAKEREQFGRAIGSFQAVKHLCADALTRAEVARAAVHAAACHLDDPDSDLVESSLATAAVLAAEAAHRNGKTCIQVHGGMGFTWEVDAHLFLKRAQVWIAAMGGTARFEELAAHALVA